MAREKISLWSTEGGADKTYTLWIEKDSKGYWVKYLHGRRGGTQTPGEKNKAAFTGEKAEEKAEKLYDSVLREKLGKGYKPLGGDVPEYVEVKEANDTGLRPQLLTPASEDDLETYLKAENWVAQEKINGKRVMVKITRGGKVIASNRRGLECPIPMVVKEALESMPINGAVLDGELVGEVYHVFDQPVRPTDPKVVFSSLVKKDGPIRIVFSEIEEDDKRRLLKRLREGRKEGIVFKKIGVPYEPGRRENLKNAIAVKIKFYAEVNAYVIDWTDKSSIEVGLRDGVGVTPVGKVTVPAKYTDQIKRGSIVRVKYLYATPGKILYQSHLDPTDDGSVIADAVNPDPIKNLKFEGKEEE